MIEFPCGCKIDKHADLSLDNINLTCPRVWDLFKDGNLIGVFQLENGFTRKFSRELLPNNIEDLAALVTIIRPGSLESLDENGKNVTNKYIDRKRGREEIEQTIKALEPLLRDTYQLMLYQEDAILIASEIAGFSLEEADSLRKAIGRKDVELMAKVKKQFIEGCLKTKKVNEKEANEIANAIEASQRYNFNKSHAVAYAHIAYLTAFCKIHFPTEFYCAALNQSKGKMKPKEELKKLVYDAYKNDVEVYPPELERLNSDFTIDKEKIYYGLSHIKDVGDSCVKKLLAINKETPLKEMCWLDLLFRVMLQINKSCAKSFMASGALRNLTNLHREQMMYEYDHASKLTKKERAGVLSLNLKEFASLIDLFKFLRNGGSGKGKILSNKNRVTIITGLINSLDEPSYDLSDNIGRLINYEQDSLGLPMTCYHSEIMNSQAYCIDLSKKEIADNTKVNVAARVDSIKEYKNDRGRTAYLAILDNTAELRGVKCYSKTWEKLRHIVQEKKDYIFTINVKGKGDNLIINNIHLL